MCQQETSLFASFSRQDPFILDANGNGNYQLGTSNLTPPTSLRDNSFIKSVHAYYSTNHLTADLKFYFEFYGNQANTLLDPVNLPAGVAAGANSLGNGSPFFWFCVNQEKNRFEILNTERIKGLRLEKSFLSIRGGVPNSSNLIFARVLVEYVTRL